MSAHANCTHLKTKAARAACRRQTDAGGTTHRSFLTPTAERKLAENAGIVKPLANEIQTPIAQPKFIKIKFSSVECSRCLGSGFHGPSSVAGGICFSCKGNKTVLTRGAENARKWYNQQIEERMGVSIFDLKPGDRILCTAQTWAGYQPVEYKRMWRTIKSIVIDTDSQSVGQQITDADGNKTTVWHHSVKIEFESTSGERTWGISMMPESFATLKFPLSNNETIQQIMTEAIKRFPKSVTGVAAE